MAVKSLHNVYGRNDVVERKVSIVLKLSESSGKNQKFIDHMSENSSTTTTYVYLSISL